MTESPRAREPLALAAVAMAVLADGDSELTGLPESPALFAMCDALRSLGVEIDSRADSLCIRGCGGMVPESEATLELADHGLALHALLALLAADRGEFTLTGVADLDASATVDALRDLGAVIGYDRHPGRPPLFLSACGLRGREVFLPAAPDALPPLLAVFPYASADVLVRLPKGVDPGATLSLMSRFGVETLAEPPRLIVPAPQRYAGQSLDLSQQSD